MHTKSGVGSVSGVPKQITYLVGPDGGAAKTDSLKATRILQAAGYRICGWEEYIEAQRRLQAEERREMERERRG